jgi:hypothetical protein
MEKGAKQRAEKAKSIGYPEASRKFLLANPSVFV